ncbi:hypothetical protein [Syntrophus aciditrophicus]|jgi:hypothetical protein|uniref:Hypothetical cytosolic protein n=1 Tax=Syntrophus aciditrophicus (strain SB) TaxID=56780 RepID=Q2LVE0_SYNAS|nr:hypothetical protein [Syntrophus aciditrophicus]ABC78052.1 hypothetical cytosolic protein [Syntrophus aciditrophicus SB]OPY18954.1 MAG: hypothetical protein A4E74_00339 [Syntrophus sp. PtaB.Bin075]
MTVQTATREKKEMRKNRRIRLFGLQNTLLSTTTFHFNSDQENRNHPAIEEASLISALIKTFSEN